MPFNFSFILFDQGKCQTCETSGCCPQTGKKQIPGNYFYRMIGPGYLMRDPLMGYYGYEWRAKPFGTNTDPAQWWNFAGVIHWNDWKPITGENVWAAILAPMQVLFIKNCSHIEKFKDFDSAPPEVQLALSIMPATEALLSPMGSMYHCPNGTKMFPPDEAEETNVSNENNFSAWAAYKAFLFILKNFYQGSDEVIDGAVDLLSKKLIPGLENWFQNHLLPAKIAGENVVSQGGHVTFDGKYEYQKGAQSFAVDCQTWGMLVLGSKRFDTWYKGTQTAYGIWKAVKKLAGYYINDEIAGVGYTTPEKNTTSKTLIWSGEWTWGAVYMCRRLAKEYETSNAAWSAELKKDAESMIKYMKKEVVPCDDGVWCDGGLVQSDGSYLYANKRFFIPWGWYANPVGATSSTGWAVLNDFLYDPFTLGGGNSTTFWKDQCANNTATPGILQKLSEWYEFKG